MLIFKVGDIVDYIRSDGINTEIIECVVVQSRIGNSHWYGLKELTDGEVKKESKFYAAYQFELKPGKRIKREESIKKLFDES